MGKFNFAEFVRGMKKNNYNQILFQLFAVDPENGELCGCALGQGVLNSGMVTPEEIKSEIEQASEYQTIEVTDRLTGKTSMRELLVSGKLEQNWTKRIEAELGTDFYGDVISWNDQSRLKMPEIIEHILTRFSHRLGI